MQVYSPAAFCNRVAQDLRYLCTRKIKATGIWKKTTTNTSTVATAMSMGTVMGTVMSTTMGIVTVMSMNTATTTAA